MDNVVSMFALRDEMKYIKATEDEIVDVLTSVNAPYVAPPGYSSESTRAYICSLKRGKDRFSVFIYLYLSRSHKGLVYCYDKDPVESTEHPGARGEAMDFVESMGFIMEKAEHTAKSINHLPPFMEDPSLLVEEGEEEGGTEDEVELTEITPSGPPAQDVKPPETRPVEGASKTGQKKEEREEEKKDEVPIGDEKIDIEIENAPAPPPKKTTPQGHEDHQGAPVRKMIGRIKLREIVPPPVENEKMSPQMTAVLKILSSL